jgi:hypothetical protein
MSNSEQPVTCISNEEIDYAIRLSFRKGDPLQDRDWQKITDEIEGLLLSEGEERTSTFLHWVLYPVCVYMILKHKNGLNMEDITANTVQEFNKENYLDLRVTVWGKPTGEGRSIKPYCVISYKHRHSDGFNRVVRCYIEDRQVIMEHLFDEVVKPILANGWDLTRTVSDDDENDE